MAKAKTYETRKAIKAITGKTLIVSYVRDENRVPIGVVVAIDRDKVGWSKRKGNTQWNASAGVICAFISAQNGDTADSIPTTNAKFRAIKDAFYEMQVRSRDYYRYDHPVTHGTVLRAGNL